MRRKERIPIILELMDTNFLESYMPYFKLNTKLILKDKWKIALYWNDNPDLRLTQVLVNMGYVPNERDFWYYREEVDFVTDVGYVRPQEIHFWGTYGFKDMNELYKIVDDINDAKPLLKDFKTEDDFVKAYIRWEDSRPTLTYKPISELETDHIEKILLGDVSDYYKSLFNDELKYREENGNV